MSTILIIIRGVACALTAASSCADHSVIAALALLACFFITDAINKSSK